MRHGEGTFHFSDESGASESSSKREGTWFKDRLMGPAKLSMGNETVTEYW